MSLRKKRYSLALPNGGNSHPVFSLGIEFFNRLRFVVSWGLIIWVKFLDIVVGAGVDRLGLITFVYYGKKSLNVENVRRKAARSQSVCDEFGRVDLPSRLACAGLSVDGLGVTA